MKSLTKRESKCLYASRKVQRQNSGRAAEPTMNKTDGTGKIHGEIPAISPAAKVITINTGTDRSGYSHATHYTTSLLLNSTLRSSLRPISLNDNDARHSAADMIPE
jgi:hypothetical protein